jgi:hypothetical protein
VACSAPKDTHLSLLLILIDHRLNLLFFFFSFVLVTLQTFNIVSGMVVVIFIFVNFEHSNIAIFNNNTVVIIGIVLIVEEKQPQVAFEWWRLFQDYILSIIVVVVVIFVLVVVVVFVLHEQDESIGKSSEGEPRPRS